MYLLVLGTAFWGISFSVTKLAVQDSSLFVFLFYRFTLASIILSIFLYRYVKRTKADSMIDGARLAVPLAAGIILQTLGLKYLPAAQCTFIAGTCVILVPVIKWAAYKMAITARIWIASGIALAGLAVISISDNFTSNQGTIYTVLGTIGFSIYLIKVEKQTGKGNMIKTVVPMFIVSTLISLLLTLTEKSVNWFPADDNFWIAIVYCAVFTTAFMYTVSMMAQKYIAAERVAVIYLFEPVFGAIAALFILNEVLHWRLFVGGGLILAATFVSEVNLKAYSLKRLLQR